VAPVPSPSVDVLALDEALQRLARLDNRTPGSSSFVTSAGSRWKRRRRLGLSPATVKRAWTLARAWLFRELTARVERQGREQARQMTDSADRCRVWERFFTRRGSGTVAIAPASSTKPAVATPS